MIPMKYLNLVHRRDLFNWSVAYHLGIGHSYSDKYPLVALGVFLYRSRNIIDVKDDIVYKRVSISTIGKGVSVRDERQGKEIGTKKQYRINSGQFLVSKIDARNGAFGVVPLEAENAIITGNFWAYDVDYNLIDPHYLALITRTKEFTSFCEKASNGTTNRHYLQESLFLSQKIPLPSLEEQNKIIAAYNATIAQAKQYSTQAKDIDKQIEKYLQDELEIETRDYTIEKQTDGFLHFINYSTIDKWGTDFMVKHINSSSSIKYKTKKICQLCNISSGGTPNRGRKEYYGGNIPWIKTGELKNEILTDTEEKITPLGMNNSSAKLYPKGSLIVAMYGATIGKTAKLGVDATTNQACAVLFDIDNKQIQTDYLWLYLQSQTDKLKAMAYGGAQPNINAGIVANYEIPLPPFDTQNEIVERITRLRKKQKDLQQKSLTLRQQATQQFEQIIFE